MQNSISQPKGAVPADAANSRLQELERNNQALQLRLAEMAEEKEQLGRDLDKLHARYEECRALLRHYFVKEDSEVWEDLHLQRGTPIEHLIAELDK